MSKESPPIWNTEDPVPSYEESISSDSLHASTNPAPFYREKSPSNTTSMIRVERTRRIQNQIINTIIPCFSEHLSNAVNNLTIILIPSDSLPNTSGTSSGTPITSRNVVTPSFQSLNTTGAVIQLTGDDNRSSFWTQQPVLSELDTLLRRELTGTSPQQDPLTPQPTSSNSKDRASQSQLTFTPQPPAPLPARPPKKSWFKRAMPQLPGPEHDPTGETGKWELGWRSSEVASENEAEAARQRERRLRILKQDEIAVATRFQDVSLRTESELGLLDTNTVKCIWIEIEVGV